jgi:RHS repeat-associated protein
MFGERRHSRHTFGVASWCPEHARRKWWHACTQPLMRPMRNGLGHHSGSWLGVLLLLQLFSLALPASVHAQTQGHQYGPPFQVWVAAPSGGNFETFPTMSQAIAAGEAGLASVNTNNCPVTSQINTDPSLWKDGIVASVTYVQCVSGGQVDPSFNVDETKYVYDVGQNAGGCDCDGGNGHEGGAQPGSALNAGPINTATGNDFQQETDYAAPSGSLTFRRFYNNQGALQTTTLSSVWRHSFDRSLSLLGGPATIAQLFRPDGSALVFQKANGVWAPSANIADTLTEQDDANGNPTGYTVFVADVRQTEQYSASGLLQSIIDPSGQQTTLTYSTASTPASIAPSPNLLLTVTDPNGRVLSFTYTSAGNLYQVKLPDGGTLTYAYDSTTGNLTKVTYPDTHTRQYVYNESALTGGSAFPSAITGVIDETGTRYSSTTYASQSSSDVVGRATSTYLAGGVATTTLSYGSWDQVEGTAPSTLTTPLGAVVSLGFMNTLGRIKVASTSASCGIGCNQPWSAQSYDTNGYPSSMTDWNSNLTQTTYDVNGLLDVEVDASGSTNQRTTTTTWNTTLRVPLTRTVQDNNAHTVSQEAWVYNAAGQVLADCQIDPTNSAATGYSCSTTGTVPSGVRRDLYTYCAAVDSIHCPLLGLTLSHTDPNGNTTSYAYYLTASASSCGTPGAACYQPGNLKTITDALGHVTTISSYDGAGRVTRRVDANGVITDLSYSPRGWLLTRTVRANANGSASSADATTTIGYTPFGAVATVTDPDGVAITYGYDPAHRLTQITDALGNSVQYTLDAAGDRTQEATYANGSTTPTTTLSRHYNTLGQLTQVTDGLGHVVFDATATGAYDGNGNLLQSKDAEGIVTAQSYDALNRVKQTIENYNGSDPATQNTTIQQVWDALNRLTQVTDPSNLVTSYGYDGLSNPNTLHSPDSGATSRSFDAAGNVLTSTDAKGVVTTNVYDALNRVTSRAYSTGPTLGIAYHYDDANSVTGCSSSYPIGRLTRIVETNVTTTYCYDQRGNVISKTQVQGAQTSTLTASYTLADRLATRTEPDGSVVSYTRNADGQISSVAATPVGSSAATVVSGVSYRPFGPISSYTLGNGQSVTRTYDANDRLTDLVSTPLTMHFARDAKGRITAEGNSAGVPTATENYAYDSLDRITGVTQPSGSVTVESLTYNGTGDRLSKTGGTDAQYATGAYSYNPNTHQLVGTGSQVREVDADGNTTSAMINWRGQLGFGYDARNRLAAVTNGSTTAATYQYNGLGERVLKTVAGATTRFVYDDYDQLQAEAAATTSKDYLWLDDLPVGVIDTTSGIGALSYVVADHLNTPRRVVNASGATIWYWAWIGNPFGEQSPSATGYTYTYNLRYPGQYYDTESALNYNIHRDYDPGTGRYLQVDPIGLLAGPSTYSYVNGSATDFADPFGLWQLTVTISLFGESVGPGGVLTLGLNSGQWNWGGWLGAAQGDSLSFNFADSGCHEAGSFASARGDGRIGLIAGLLDAEFTSLLGPSTNSVDFTTGIPLLHNASWGWSFDNGVPAGVPSVSATGGESVFLGGGGQHYFEK